MEDDIDIYEDLPSFEAKDGEKYKEEIKELSQRCNDFQQENAELKVKVAELLKSNQTLSDNLSSLLKTAKAEISRKDRMITELRQQHDNMAFRRGGFKQKTRKPQENHSRHNNYAPNNIQEASPMENQPISLQEPEDEIEEPEQKYEPEKIASTVFGERLRKKILLEQEAERIQKEEAKLAMLESKAMAEQVKVEAIVENETTSDIVKKEPQELPNNSPEEAALSIKSSAHSLNEGSSHSYEEDDRNLSERREFVNKFLGKRIDHDAGHPESKRRRIDDERYHSDDTRHFNGNFRPESRLNFESKDNSRASGDTANRLGHRRGSNNREEFARARRGDRGKSIYRSRSRTPDRRHVEKRADRHRTDRYRAYMDKCEKRRHSGTNRDKNYGGKFNSKDAHDLREKIEHRVEPKIGGKCGYGDYKNGKLDKEEKRGGRASPAFDESRSRSRGRSNCNAGDNRRTRLAKSSDRMADAVGSEESSRERKGVKTRSKNVKREVADRKDFDADRKNFDAETKLEKSSRTRSGNEKVNNKQASSTLQLCGSGNEMMNKQIASTAQLPDGLISVATSDLVPEEIKKQRKSSRRNSKDLESVVVEDGDRDSELKSQTTTSANSEKEVTNKQLVPPTELSEASEKEITNKRVVSSTQLSESSEKEVTNQHLVFTSQPLSVRLALISKPNETPEEVTNQHKGARRKSKDSEPAVVEEKICGTESKLQTLTETNSEEKATNEQIERGKSNDSKSTVPEENDRDYKPKSETQSRGTSEKEETNNKLASCVLEADDSASKVESTEVPTVKNCQKDESAESTIPALRNEPNQVESSSKMISSLLQTETEEPSIPSELSAPSDVGSRSFREEKIENIEKFIQNYQDDENVCCRIADVDTEELNDANKSCSSILEALSMDLELDAIGKPEDELLMKNSLVGEQLLLESLSTPVKKNNPPLPPFSPPKEMQQPPLPPVPPPDDVAPPPLPPIPYPEEIKQQSLPPLPPSVEKTQPPLPDEKVEELPPLPPTDEETKNSPPLSSEEKKEEPSLPSPERRQQPPLPSPEKRPQPPLPSPERKTQPPLPPPDCDDEIFPTVPPLDVKEQPLPTSSSPDKTKSSSPLIESLDDKNQLSPSLLSLDDKKQILPSVLPLDDKNQLSLSLLPKDDTKKISPSLPSTSEKIDLPLSSPGLEDKTKSLSSPGLEDKTKSLSSPKLEDKTKPLSSPGLEDKAKPLLPPEQQDKTKTLPSPQLEDKTKPQSSPKLEDKTKPLSSPQLEDKTKPLSSIKLEDKSIPLSPPKLEDKTKPLSSSGLEDKRKPLSSPKLEDKTKPLTPPKLEDKSKPLSAPQLEDKTKTLSSPELEDKTKPLSSPELEDKTIPLSSPKLEDKAKPLSSPKLEDKTKPLLSKQSASSETEDLPLSALPVPNRKVDLPVLQVPTPKEKNDKLSSEASAPKEKKNKLSSEASAPKDKTNKLSSEASAPKEKNNKLSSEASAPKEKNDKHSSEAPEPSDENETSETKEISASKTQPEKTRMEKIAPKQISRRHKIPCIPIASRYSRKRRDMVLTDSEAARCIIKSDSSSDTETNNNATAPTKFQHVFTKEPKVILKPIESSKIGNAKSEQIHDNPEAMIGKPEERVEVSKISATKNKSKTESEIPSDKSESRESEKIVPKSSEIVAATIFDEAATNLPTESEKRNAEANQPEMETEEQAASLKVRKRSALKTIVPPDPGGDGGGASASRKRTLPKEKENQSRQAEKKCKIMVVARRRRPVHLEDSSTATTLVSSAQEIKCDDSLKNSAKNISVSEEKSEISQSIAGSVSKGRKRRSADK